jgi:hypothetical protein
MKQMAAAVAYLVFRLDSLGACNPSARPLPGTMTD